MNKLNVEILGEPLAPGEIPKNVVDMDAFNKWNQLKQELDDLPHRYIKHDISGRLINMCTTAGNVRKMTSDLPTKRREEIEKLHRDIREKMLEIKLTKKKAFSLKFGMYAKVDDKGLNSKYTELCELFGRCYTGLEVFKIVTQEWGYEVTQAWVDSFRKRNIERIQSLQEEYKKTFTNIRLGWKRSRLDELTYLYEDRKGTYKAKKRVEDYQLLLKTLEQIRKEVEGDRLLIDGKLEIDIEQNVNIHIQQDLMKDLSINEIIMSKAAGRMGVNVVYFLAALNKSFYSKYTGFSKQTEEFVNPLYPSHITYDFDDIRKKSTLKMKELDSYKEPEQFEEAQVVERFKDTLLHGIKTRKLDLNKTMKRLQELDNESQTQEPK